MTLDQAKTLKEGQQIWYRAFEELPEKVVISKIIRNDNGKLEIHLVDNCYIPERDLDYIFLTFEDCAKACEKYYNEKLNKLRQMIAQGK